MHRGSNPKPTVSIGVPVYNGENYLAEALGSLVNQTFDDLEIVIADNASQDATADICRDFAARDPRITYLRNETNLGAAKNYNLVFARSRGRYFKWAAHDDVIEPTYVERCAGVLERDPSVVACYPRTRYVDAGGREQRVSNGQLGIEDADPVARVRKLVDLEIRSDDVLMSVFGMFRHDALRRTRLIGGYPASDQVLMLELALLGRFHEVDEPLFVRRMHPLVSMVKNRTPHAQAEWFDSAHRKRIVMPVWGLWRQHIGAVRRSELGLGARARCYWHLARRFMRKWPALAGEIKKGVFQLFGRR